MSGGYLRLYETGELRRRAEVLEQRLVRCDLCPRGCGANRFTQERGWCRSGCLPIVCAVCAHHGEEPPISGDRGTGAIFFGNCNLRCVFCQNYRISQDPEAQVSRTTTSGLLARHMLYLQDELGCHSISLVSPSHFVPQVLRALLSAVPAGLRVPIVYNSNGYDSVSTLRVLEGIVDIYLPDLKYGFDHTALELSAVTDYVSKSREAIREMYRQVGSTLVLDDHGVACHGMIVRHLVLPGYGADSRSVLTWLSREFSKRLAVSIMAQYWPTHRAKGMPDLNRTVSVAEYTELLELAQDLGLESIWVQTLDSAGEYLPDFERGGDPFSARGIGDGVCSERISGEAMNTAR